MSLSYLWVLSAVTPDTISLDQIPGMSGSFLCLHTCICWFTGRQQRESAGTRPTTFRCGKVRPACTNSYSGNTETGGCQNLCKPPILVTRSGITKASGLYCDLPRSCYRIGIPGWVPIAECLSNQGEGHSRENFCLTALAQLFWGAFRPNPWKFWKPGLALPGTNHRHPE